MPPRAAQCTELTVPLDYSRPGGRTIELSVLKVPAERKNRRVGALVVNPGGPGGSSLDYATGGSSYWGHAIRGSFDIVGFDPRGVGESTPLTCVGDDQLDDLLETDPSPDTADEVRQDHALWKAFFAGCMQRDAELATHVGTQEAARDLDILRAALGEPRLTYFGASYGTFLGGIYADLFPANVGRLVLDGAVDPSVPTLEANLVQAKGFETALRAYVAACVDEGDCFLGDSVEAGVERVQQFLSDLDQRPIAGSATRPLTEGLGLYGLITPLYNRDYWRILDAALEAGLRGQGAPLLALAEAYTSRGPDGYTDNAFQMLPVVNCLDSSKPVPERRITKALPRFEREAPTFARFFTADLGVCGDWSFSSGRQGADLTAKGSAPILVVGTTRDPATPLEWAEGLASQLANARLLTRDGDGHTAYNSGNDCIDDTIERYLVSGKVPKDNTAC